MNMAMGMGDSDPWGPEGVYTRAVERGRLEDEAKWDRDQRLWEAQDPANYLETQGDWDVDWDD